MSLKLDINTANNELQEKSYELIQKETSIKWASRAAASYIRSQGSKTIELKMRWFQYAVDYHNEALEHSVFSNDTQLQKDIESFLKTYNIKTVDDIKKWKTGQ